MVNMDCAWNNLRLSECDSSVLPICSHKVRTGHVSGEHTLESLADGVKHGKEWPLSVHLLQPLSFYGTTSHVNFYC